MELALKDDADRYLPHDGQTFGRLLVRGATIARAYFREPTISVLEDEDFFDTGDVATMDDLGFMQITD